MKKIMFTISLVFVLTSVSYSQASLTLSNLQGCDLDVTLYEYNVMTCFITSNVTHNITSGSVTLYNSAAGTEFIYAEIIPSLSHACFPSSLPVSIETDGLACAAVTCAGPGLPTIAVIPSTGCGCSNPITLQWDACASGSILFF